MKSRKPVVALLMLTFVFLAMNAAAQEPAKFKGQFTYQDVIAPGATQTDTYAINNNGAITGDYIDVSGVQHGMILKGDTLTTIDNSDCASGIAFFGINAANRLAGWCTAPTSLAIAFTYANGTFTTISPPGAVSTQANGINDKGVVVGSYVDSAGLTHGFLFNGKKYTTLDCPGCTANGGYSVAWSINNSGVIAVYGLDSSGGTYISFTTKDKGVTYTPFAYSGAGTLGTVIHAVSNKGDIDATYFDSNSLGKGVLLHKGKYYSFQEPNDCGVSPCSTRADGLNNPLQIVGRYSPSDGSSHGFIAQAK